MKERRKGYDTLHTITEQSRPKVLLVGNGINLSFPGARDTDTIIQKEWQNHYNEELPARPKVFDNKENIHPVWKLPFPLEVVAATKDHVQGCMTELAKTFRDAPVSDNHKAFIESIVNARFDAVLSTNYSLEFEKSMMESYSSGKAYRHYRITEHPTPRQKEYGIFQCTQIHDTEKTYLWHIHGTALRKKSLIMGQLYYGKLLSEVIDRAYKVNQEYLASANYTFTAKSWVDYFLLGDVYIMGFTLDYSETDIWWLLSYKKSVFPQTTVYYYEPEVHPEKKLLLTCYDINTPEVFFNTKESKAVRYINYYARVLDDIKRKSL